MRERRTGDSFWTRRSCRPVKRTYFLSTPTPGAPHGMVVVMNDAMVGVNRKRRNKKEGRNVPECLGLHKVRYLTIGKGP